MAKKISKHSRAARRGEVDEGIKELEKLPKAESDGVKKSIIRTTIKNENLLNAKMESSRVKKNKKKTNSLKHRLERSDKLSGVLSTKIEQSIARAKYVQNARKAGWDQINKNIKNELIDEKRREIELSGKAPLTEQELEQEAEDEYVKNFYQDDEQEEEVKPQNPANKFALLEETEA
ncbi:uncharacterized protein CANTADRAFT_26088 [Suhomyces tanzawaensis NRRL Y-17324]|uniref:Alb1-domain-containing protein n=1 Tax=Suhomyces tanzawaensis NRRL Y-17324 TaxID=984487 RepID=A0A1E4SHT6_9ASCO|nr:uncharacterized protein CANTADRAFT_26088 [Suhomyces tanzawaensis NRRL Y-17324]ODV79007.1 hypothetical protein CANTADRAFT_26088 [Suhomyces tanzawaensis NRRL Y-17324]